MKTRRVELKDTLKHLNEKTDILRQLIAMTAGRKLSSEAVNSIKSALKSDTVPVEFIKQFIDPITKENPDIKTAKNEGNTDGKESDDDVSGSHVKKVLTSDVALDNVLFSKLYQRQSSETYSVDTASSSSFCMSSQEFSSSQDTQNSTDVELTGDAVTSDDQESFDSDIDNDSDIGEISLTGKSLVIDIQ